MRIGLGTVQFGLAYGITNQAGQVGRDPARAILTAAEAAGIDTLDTAHLYGDSEAVLGRLGNHAFRIVTKTPKFHGLTAEEAAAGLHDTFKQSLTRLERRRVHGLLLHDPSDLLGPLGPTLWRQMERLKADGLVAKIGVSIYEGGEVDAALGDYPIDLVQLPYNPLDQRLVSGGQLARLAAAGVEVHARSLFLQGLLLQPPERIPAKFQPLAEAVAGLRAAGEAAGLSQLETLLSLAFRHPEIDRFICGATTLEELQAIVCAAEKVEGMENVVEVATFPPLDPRLLNPTRWSELG